MDPVLSGSLCFLVLAIIMYVKFIREHPWTDEDGGRDHKSSPVEPDTVPFLHPASPVHAKKQSESAAPVQQTHALHGLAVLQKAHQYKSMQAGAAGGGVAGGSAAQKQPMRRRAHSAATNAGGGGGVGASSASVATTTTTMTTETAELEPLPSTIYETHDLHEQHRYPPSSGRDQHRINFDSLDFDHELGYLSDRDREDSLQSVPFEDHENDRYVDLESDAVGELRASFLDIEDSPPVYRASKGSDLMTPSKADTVKTATAIERQFVRDSVAQPAQMQLEVARKARIPLFLHSPMYVKTSAAPLVDDVIALQKHEDKDVEDAMAAANGGALMRSDDFGMSARRKEKLPPNASKNNSLHIEFSELKVAEMIGQGAFGTVHRATWRGTAVAVKILVCQYLTVEILEEFETEVQIMSILRHPNICLLMGACLEPPTRCLVIEYLPRGSLWNVLRQDVVIDYTKQMGFARDTAQGMNYLHSFHPPILHRDLKSPNLLVDSSYAIKISDFGLARVRAHFQTMTGNCGTTQWMAPEVLAAEKYTEKADVFSYAIVCWETITRQCPYEGLSQIQAALGVLNNNLRPAIPANCPPLFKTLMTLCWVSKPEERPTFETILELLANGGETTASLRQDQDALLLDPVAGNRR